MIIVNLKIYKEAFGEKAVKLAEICRDVSKESGVRIIVASSAVMAVELMKTGAEVFLQDYDEYSEGRFTGMVSAKQAMELGIKGSILNHSEKPKKKGTIFKTVKAAPEGFETVLCVKSIGQIEKWARRTKVNFLAYEPKHLIASKTASVASEQPEAIKRAVEASGGIPLLAGAGVKSEEDVRVALKMGAKGVLVASDIVCSDNPEKELRELVKGFGK